MRPKMFLGLTSLLGAWLCLATLARADVTLDTTPYWDGYSTIQPFGLSDTATYGQTFVAPVSGSLTDFTFFVTGDSSADLSLKGAVFAWSGSLLGGGGGGAIGPALFLSSSFNYTGNGNFQSVTVNTGGVGVTAGQQYVMLLTVSDPVDYNRSTGTTQWGDVLYTHAPGSASGGGGFVFYNNGDNFGALNTSAWDNFADFGDLAFVAHIRGAAVPEPSTLAIAGLGIAGIVAHGFRRRRVR